jgi:UDP:flavonoid glycosyltransferase YjiC (YdhE family)
MRIVITTFGSYGDLHPYLALGRGLKQRGHTVVIATSASYRASVEQAGLELAPIRPDLNDFGPFAEVARRVYDPRKGAQYIVRELMMPSFAATYDDLQAAARGADLLITHALSYAGHLLARAERMRWVSTILSPMVFMSMYEPPLLPPAPWLRSLWRFSPALYRFAFRAMKTAALSWTGPIRAFCKQRRLPLPEAHPLFENQYSPYATLALFSPLLATPQPDWPGNTHVTGFCTYQDTPLAVEVSARIDDFLAHGEAPIVFTLGSSAVYVADDFYAQSIEIARRLKRRALLLTGPRPDAAEALDAGPDALAIEYAPYPSVLPRAAAVVHQCGIGTLAHAMHAGHPMLIVPFSHDQPDNAERAARLNIARVIARRRFSVETGAQALDELLANPLYASASREVARKVGMEDGVGTACDVLERVMSR